MADTIEYIVRIKGLGDSEDAETKMPRNALSKGLDSLHKILNPKTNLSHEKDEGGAVFVLKETSNTAVKAAATAIPLQINRYYKLSEDYKSQNYLNNVMLNINRAKGMANSAISGARTAGMVAGPEFALVGALMGATSDLVVQAIQWNNTIANYNSTMNATVAETNYKAKRAGLYNGGKGTEN